MAPPSLHRVPSGAVPCFISIIKRSAFPPFLSSGFVALPFRYRLSTRFFAPFPLGMLPKEGIRKRSSALPIRIPFTGDDWASQILKEPPCLHALLFDTGGTVAPLLIHARIVPSPGNTPWHSATHLSWLNHIAYRPRMYASQSGLSQDHAKLSSGC